MTIASEANRSGPYACNGATRHFPFSFRVYDATHIRVILTDPQGIEATLSLDTDYTVSGVGQSGGGAADMAVAYAPGYRVTLILNVPFTQNIDLENQGAYFAETIERAIDLQTQMSLQLKEQVARSVVLPVTSSVSVEKLTSSVLSLSEVQPQMSALASVVGDIKTVAGISGAIVAAEGHANTATASATLATGKATEAAASAAAARTWDPAGYYQKAETNALLSTKASKRNRILNPALQVNQDRSLGSTIVVNSTSAYVIDGCLAYAVGGGALACSQVAKLTPGGSPYRLRAAVSTADPSIAATDYYGIQLVVEGAKIADFMLGLASARVFGFRIVVNFPAGTYNLRFGNNNHTRSYVTQFTIALADAGKDTLIPVVIPGDTIGGWLRDVSGSGLNIDIVLATGSTYITSTPNTWLSGNYVATAAQTNGMASTENVFEICDFGLYCGSEFPDWEMPSYEEDFVECHRLWRVIAGCLLSGGNGSYGGAVNQHDISNMRPVPPGFAIYIVASATNWSGGITPTYEMDTSPNVFVQRSVRVNPISAQPDGSYAAYRVVVNARL